MGTDIHTAIEVRRDGEWTYQGPFPSCYDKATDSWDWDKDYECRNYTWFAVLADVRNGFGFAGVYRHEPLEPIAPGRGIPKDCSPVVKRIQDAGGMIRLDEEQVKEIGLMPGEFRDYEGEYTFWLGDHSLTWVTLKEILDYPWETSLPSGGVLSLEEYSNWDKESRPESYCGGISGPKIIVLSQDAADALLNGDVEPKEGKDYYVQCQWTNPLEDSIQWIRDLWVEYLSPLGEPEDVRVIMGFDS